MSDGTHIGGSLTEVRERAEALGCTAVQVFMHNPKAYLRRKPPSQAETVVVQDLIASGVKVNAHATYPCVITNPWLDDRTQNAFRGISEQVAACRQLGIDKLVLHPGRIRQQSDIDHGVETLRNLAPILEAGQVQLLLENASTGNHQRLEALAHIIEVADLDSWVGICLDTAHSYGAGYDLSDEVEFDDYLQDFAKHIMLVHFNNSIAELGSKKDRHGRLVEGLMSKDQLRKMYGLLRQSVGEVPFIIEATDDLREIHIVKLWHKEVSTLDTPAQ